MSVNFNLVARPYRWLEYLSFGPWLARCRNAQLVHLTGARHALVLGDGDGRFLGRLLSEYPELTADVIDSSPCMLTVLDRRIRRLGPQARNRICLRHGDALSSPLDGEYDLIVTHFFIDCFFPEEVETLADRVLAHASRDARWLISEFAIPSNRFARPVARALVGSLYRAFGLLTGLKVRDLPDYATALRRRGLVPSQQQSFLAGLLGSQLWVRSSLEPNIPLAK